MQFTTKCRMINIPFLMQNIGHFCCRIGHCYAWCIHLKYCLILQTQYIYHPLYAGVRVRLSEQDYILPLVSMQNIVLFCQPIESLLIESLV